jgi:hypothetical protein
MRDRQPFDSDSAAFKNAKLLYNLSQIVVCAIVFAALLPYFITAEHSYGIGIALNSDVEWWVFVYYCCKLLDFGDTLFMVLGKKQKQLSFLHVWHHGSIVPLFSFYLSSGIAGGSICTLPLLNSLVHVLMYSHYLITSVRKFKNMWWKPLITSSQMGHHAVLMVYMVLNVIYGSPGITFAVAAVGLLWGVSILGLFGKFYHDEYVQKKEKRVRSTESGKESLTSKDSKKES